MEWTTVVSSILAGGLAGHPSFVIKLASINSVKVSCSLVHPSSLPFLIEHKVENMLKKHA